MDRENEMLMGELGGGLSEWGKTKHPSNKSTEDRESKNERLRKLK